MSDLDVSCINLNSNNFYTRIRVGTFWLELRYTAPRGQGLPPQVVITWNPSRVYDSYDYVNYADDADLQFMQDPSYIDVDELTEHLSAIFNKIASDHEGRVEWGISDKPNGLSRIHLL